VSAAVRARAHGMQTHLRENTHVEVGAGVAHVRCMNDKLKDKIDDAADKAKDIADKAGKKIEQGADKVSEKARDAADKVEDGGRDLGKKIGG
jgi:methyl-accepting chemotaxis protein